MFCTNCRAEIQEGTKFCTKCGAPVPQLNPVAQEISRQMATKDVPNIAPDLNSPQKSGAGAKKIALIAGLIGVAAALVGVIAYLLFFTEIGERVQSTFAGTAKEEEVDVDEIGGSKKSKDEDEEELTEEVVAEEEEVENAVFTGQRKPVDIQVRQVDNTNFPEITLYANVLDENGNNVENLTSSDLVVKEIAKDGSILDASIEDVYRLKQADKININLVLDQSGSMHGSKMDEAKAAAKTLIDKMTLERTDKVEVISFDDYVYLQQEFTSQTNLLATAIDNIEPYGSTALFDALYAGVYQTYYENGAKCVIGFTDGEENASSYSYQDVVEISRNTGIPVFIIGIGDSSYNYSTLQSLATECSGRYYSAGTNDLQAILEDIYLSIYQEQQDYYVVKYTASNLDNPTEYRDIVLETSESSEFTGSYTKSYKPQADITGAFSDKYADRDFMIDDSSTRTVTSADLAGMTLAELRIARNEIFARHGRQFKDPLLNQWFYSKTWYLNISEKYSPDEFLSKNGRSLSKIENDNAEFILNYEKSKMSSEDIFPDASTVELSDYDLALTDVVLRQALQQMNSYPDSETLRKNRQLIQDAIDKDDITY